MRTRIVLATVCAALAAACSAGTESGEGDTSASSAGGQGGAGGSGGAGGASCVTETKCATSTDCPGGTLCNAALPEPACQTSGCGDLGSPCSEDALCGGGNACLQSKCAPLPECCVAACEQLQLCGGTIASGCKELCAMAPQCCGAASRANACQAWIDCTPK